MTSPDTDGGAIPQAASTTYHGVDGWRCSHQCEVHGEVDTLLEVAEDSQILTLLTSIDENVQCIHNTMHNLGSVHEPDSEADLDISIGGTD